MTNGSIEIGDVSLDDLRFFKDPSIARIEAYDHAKHFNMIQDWGTELEPSALGCGLVMPRICCGFVDGIGRTSTAYFYGLRANPKLSAITRTRAMIRLGMKIIESAQLAGYLNGVTSTSNPVIDRFWTKWMGFKSNGETVLAGEL